MRIDIIAVGRMKAGQERDLFQSYVERIEAMSRAVTLGPITLIEVEEKKRLERAELAEREGEKILSALASGAKLIALDERGKSLESLNFAERLRGWRDESVPTTAFVIGGAGGLSETVRVRADLTLSFGSQTWPHMLARIMLAEQIYRASTIIAGHPYHREG
ncbi:MAG: 23S rRNA (pseudouridine(1915)-N(3))-methyltransferase RlmH [Parvibaculum sp.]